MYTSISDLFAEIRKSGKDWLKSQFKISLMTFILVMAGLFIADAVCENKYGSGIALDAIIPLIALVIAIVDAIPVLGISACMIPWAALVTIFSENRMKGLALLIVFIAVMVIKQIAEPFIRGKSLGVTPLEEVAAALLGWLVFPGTVGSAVGLIVVPILYTVGKRVYVFKTGHMFKDTIKTGSLNDKNTKNTNVVVDITDDVEEVDES